MGRIRRGEPAALQGARGPARFFAFSLASLGTLALCSYGARLQLVERPEETTYNYERGAAAPRDTSMAGGRDHLGGDKDGCALHARERMSVVVTINRQVHLDAKARDSDCLTQLSNASHGARADEAPAVI